MHIHLSMVSIECNITFQQNIRIILKYRIGAAWYNKVGNIKIWNENASDKSFLFAENEIVDLTQNESTNFNFWASLLLCYTFS